MSEQAEVTSLAAEVAARRNLPPPELARSIRRAAGVSIYRLAEELDVSPLTILAVGARAASAPGPEPHPVRGSPHRAPGGWAVSTTIEDLPAILTVEEAGRFLRIGRDAAYAACRRWETTGGRDGLPCVRLGRSLRVPRHALVRFLDVGASDAPGPSSG